MPARDVATTRKASEPGRLIPFPENHKGPQTDPALSPAQQGNPLSVTKYGLEKLRAEGQLTLREFNSMSRVCDAVFAAQRGKIDIRTAHATVRRIYDELLVNEASSPMALAIASVASGALASDLGNPLPAGAEAASKPNGKIGLVGGMVAGGIIGGAIGGIGGAIIGGVIGGIVGGVAGACTKS